jgi:opacity protein-like surface antigen
MILMASVKAILCAGAIALGAASGARAADLLPPPPPVEPVYAPSFNGWYLRGDVGAAHSTISDLRSTFNPGFVVGGDRFDSNTIASSAIIGLGAGYQFNNWFRADVTGEYRTEAAYNAIESYGPLFCGSFSGRCYDGYTASLSSAVFLANGYVDIGTWYGVTPYVGAGVGVSNVWFKGLTDTSLTNTGGAGVAPDKSSTQFAWALMAGMSYALTPNLKLDFGYRYLDMGDISSASIVCNSTPCGYEVQHFKLASHDIRLGLRYMFATFDPPAPPLQAPLIRKY